MASTMTMVVMIATEANGNISNDGNGCDGGEDSDGREEAGGKDNGKETYHSEIKVIYSHTSQYCNTTGLDETRTTALMKSRRLDMGIMNYVEVIPRLRVFFWNSKEKGGSEIE